MTVNFPPPSNLIDQSFWSEAVKVPFGNSAALEEVPSAIQATTATPAASHKRLMMNLRRMKSASGRAGGTWGSATPVHACSDSLRGNRHVERRGRRPLDADEVDRGHLLPRVRVGPGGQIQADTVAACLGRFVLPLPGHLHLVPGGWGTLGVPPVAQVLAVFQLDGGRGSVVVVDAVLGDRLAVLDHRLGLAEQRGVEEVQLGRLPADRDTLDLVRFLLGQERAAEVDETLADLELDPGEGLFPGRDGG